MAELIIRTGKVEKVCLIDDDDLPLFSKYNWSLKYSENNDAYYPITIIRKNGKVSSVRLSRLIMNTPMGLVVDHINNNTMDNRKENLRNITNAQNQQNRKGAQKRNKSGIRGVTWHHTGRWRVRVGSEFICYCKKLEHAEVIAMAFRKELMPFSKEGQTK